MRLVTLLPSVPASGESLTRKVIDSVGGSIGWAGSGSVDLGRADGVGDGGVGQAGERDDVAGARLVERDALEPAEGEHLRDAALLDQLAVMVEHLDRLVRRDRAGGDAAGDDAAEIGIGLEDGAEQAERPVLDLGRGDVREHEVEQRLHAEILRPLGARRHPALLGRAVEDGEVELLVGRVERGEEVEHLVHHLGRRARRGGRPC